MNNHWLRITCLGCLILSPLLFGQEFRATLTGRVVDSSNAAVPKAVVQVRNTATSEVASAVTDTQGDYTVPFLRPGTYTISTEVPGFKKFVREGLVLDVGQTAAANVTLEVGALTEQVTVVGEALERKLLHALVVNQSASVRLRRFE